MKQTAGWKNFQPAVCYFWQKFSNFAFQILTLNRMEREVLR